MMRRPLAGLPVLLALLAACDIPSAAPKWDMTWNVPGQTSSISVNSFLPGGAQPITANAGNTAFQTTVPNVTITQTLAQDCAACAAANGLTVPKPAFVGSGSGGTSLPASVTAATLVGDTLVLTIVNGFNFDPLRPSAAAGSAKGFVIDTVRSGSVVIGRDSANGADVPLPASGGTLVRKIPLSGIVSGASGVTVTVSVNSPAGDAVTINTAQSISFTGSVGTLKIASATLSITNQAVNNASPTSVDLSGIDSSVSGHVNSGIFFLTITNPFAVTGNLTLTFSGGAQVVTKSVALAAGNSTISVAFSKADLTALLGHQLTLTFSGTVAGTSVTVSPGQTVSVVSRLQMNIETVSQ